MSISKPIPHQRLLDGAEMIKSLIGTSMYRMTQTAQERERIKEFKVAQTQYRKRWEMRKCSK